MARKVNHSSKQASCTASSEAFCPLVFNPVRITVFSLAEREKPIALATQVGGNVLFDVAKWAWDKVTGHKDDINSRVVHEACFATLDVRMHPTNIEDNFTVTFPAAVASLESTLQA